MSFVMPSKYKTKADLPEPKNPGLRLREVEAHTVAAIAWRYGLMLTALHSFSLEALQRWPLMTLLLSCEPIAMRVGTVPRLVDRFPPVGVFMTSAVAGVGRGRARS